MGAKRVLADHDSFSSRFGPDWMIFADPPRHTKLRALVSQAFTPRSIANLEPRIAELSRDLLNEVIERGEMDMALDFAIPLPMMVIAEMLGIPVTDRARFRHWNDVLVAMSYTIGAAHSPRSRQGNERLSSRERRNVRLCDALARPAARVAAG